MRGPWNKQNTGGKYSRWRLATSCFSLPNGKHSTVEHSPIVSPSVWRMEGGQIWIKLRDSGGLLCRFLPCWSMFSLWRGLSLLKETTDSVSVCSSKVSTLPVALGLQRSKQNSIFKFRFLQSLQHLYFKVFSSPTNQPFQVINDEIKQIMYFILFISLNSTPCGQLLVTGNDPVTSHLKEVVRFWYKHLIWSYHITMNPETEVFISSGLKLQRESENRRSVDSSSITTVQWHNEDETQYGQRGKCCAECKTCAGNSIIVWRRTHYLPLHSLMHSPSVISLFEIMKCHISVTNWNHQKHLKRVCCTLDATFYYSSDLFTKEKGNSDLGMEINSCPTYRSSSYKLENQSASDRTVYHSALQPQNNRLTKSNA